MLESYFKLVAIGTIADVVPLTGENCVIVHTDSRDCASRQSRPARDDRAFRIVKAGRHGATGGFPTRAANERRRAHGDAQDAISNVSDG